jgi:cytochrome P450
MLLDCDTHIQRRRLLVSPFRGKQLASYSDIITEIAESEIANWPRGRPVALHLRLVSITTDIILRVVLGNRGPTASTNCEDKLTAA